MKKLIAVYTIFLGLALFAGPPLLLAQQDKDSEKLSIQSGSQNQDQEEVPESVLDPEHIEEHGHAPLWLVIPFALLLLMIATGPLFYESFWHHHYPKIAVVLAVIVVSYYLFVLHNVHQPIHALAEYIQFIALLASLYVASGGILIEIDKKSTPMANVTLLLVGALISNLIGT